MNLVIILPASFPATCGNQLKLLLPVFSVYQEIFFHLVFLPVVYLPGHIAFEYILYLLPLIEVSCLSWQPRKTSSLHVQNILPVLFPVYLLLLSHIHCTHLSVNNPYTFQENLLHCSFQTMLSIPAPYFFIITSLNEIGHNWRNWR